MEYRDMEYIVYNSGGRINQICGIKVRNKAGTDDDSDIDKKDSENDNDNCTEDNGYWNGENKSQITDNDSYNDVDSQTDHDWMIII